MKMRMLIVLKFMIFSSASAQAFTLNYSTAGGYSFDAWQTESLNFDYNYTNCSIASDQIEAAIRAALEVWNGVPSSSLSVGLGSSVSTTPAQAKGATGPGNPVIVCDPSFSATTGTDGNFVPAAASITFANAGHHITNAVLYLNSETGKNANIANIDRTTLTVVMAHEIGHALGLGHSSDVNALMYYDASSKTQLSLSKDDTDGISYLYPRNELGGSPMLGCNSIKPLSPLEGSKNKTSDSAGLFVEFSLLALVFYSLSRRRYRKIYNFYS